MRGRPWCSSRARLIILSACMASLMMQACQGPIPSTRIACGSCEGQDRMVRLQSRATSSDTNNPPFAHPVTFSPDDLRVILKSIHVQKENPMFLLFSSKGPVEQVFRDDEIEYLSTILNRVFAEAQPEEQVIFALSRPLTPDITEITAGAWFVREQSLHLVLAYYRFAATMATVHERIWQDPLHPDSAPSYDFVPGKFQTAMGETMANSQLLAPTLPSLSISYKELLLKGLPSEPVEDTPRAAQSELSIEERLRQLKRLKEQGLVTEEEYSAKKKQLLEGL